MVISDEQGNWKGNMPGAVFLEQEATHAGCDGWSRAFTSRQRWVWAAICGLLATLARSQGVLLLPVAGLILLEQNGFDLRDRTDWIDQVRKAVVQGWMLILIPMGFVGFTIGYVLGFAICFTACSMFWPPGPGKR